MNSSVSRPAPRTAFVTGATGLLANKLVRFLIDKEGSPPGKPTCGHHRIRTTFGFEGHSRTCTDAEIR
jgi:hypothetical protein